MMEKVILLFPLFLVLQAVHILVLIEVGDSFFEEWFEFFVPHHD